MNPTILRCGIARNRALGFVCLFQRLAIKRSIRFRVWPVAGRDEYIEMSPTEFRSMYKVIAEHKTDAPGRPT